jgi:phage-related protein
MSQRLPGLHRNTPRRGLSLVVVMIAISMSLVLTYAALSSQARGVQVRQNVNRKEMARQAAESGAAIALNQLQLSTWSGVTTPLNAVLGSDKLGSTSYTVEFLTIDGQTSPSAYPTGQGGTSLSGAAAFFNSSSAGLSIGSASTAATATRQAFQLLVRSTGKWASLTDPLDFVTETVEVGVELQPRVPGRTILAPDIVQATDVLASNAGYDQIQTYAVFTSSGSGSQPSLIVEPGQRIDGPTWLRRGIDVFSGPRWKDSVRDDFLQSVGSVFTVGSGSSLSWLHPHPFGGPVTHVNNLTAAEASDLAILNVSHSAAGTSPTTPSITFSSWKTYQLYQGGFRYDAEILKSGSLDGVVLRPSLRNPLGVFYHEGSLKIDDNVVVQGTIICSGKLTFTGTNVLVETVNWRDSAGGELVANGTLFPRLPAMVAQSLEIDSTARASIAGAVLLTSSVSGGDGLFGFVNGNDLNLAGTQATSAPIRQPYSEVQLPAGTSLSAVRPGEHAIWLADGNSGNWFPIIDVDTSNRRLTILGEARRSSPTSFRIRRQRNRAFDVRGPVMASRVQLADSNSWKLSSGLWNNQHFLWQLTTQVQQTSGQPIAPFVTWVASPSSYVGWGSPWEDVGLPLEPVVHVRPSAGLKFRDSPPLFQSYVPPANIITAGNDPSGYRWRVMFWRDVP